MRRIGDTDRMIIGHLAAAVGHAADTVRAIVDGHRRSRTAEGDLPPMAQQTTITLVDDLDETLPAAETIRFGVDGTSYEIDLSAEHAAALREDVATWVTHARRTGARPHRTPTRTTRGAAQPQRSGNRTSANRKQTATVRDWARSNGYTVSDRGRIPTAVQDAFDSTH